MKKKIDKKIILIIILLIILIGIIIIYISQNSSTVSESNFSSEEMNNLIFTEISEDNTTSTTISTTGEIKSSLEENLELHATYYFEKIYVSENEYISQGEKILEYTNGTYLLAPYDCIITEILVPGEEEICTNQHYIAVKATNTVSMSLVVDETQINSVSNGQEATLYIPTIDKTYTGYITKISSTASRGKFTITAEFANDGDIKIGMTGKCSITVI